MTFNSSDNCKIDSFEIIQCNAKSKEDLIQTQCNYLFTNIIINFANHEVLHTLVHHASHLEHILHKEYI